MSARKPEGRLENPDTRERSETNDPACAMLKPIDAAMTGRTTVTTPR